MFKNYVLIALRNIDRQRGYSLINLLAIVANLVAAPVSYILMKSWLREFAYRIPLGWGIFAGAAAATLLVAQLTVIGQAVRSALTSPAETLRWE